MNMNMNQLLINSIKHKFIYPETIWIIEKWVIHLCIVSKSNSINYLMKIMIAPHVILSAATVALVAQVEMTRVKRDHCATCCCYLLALLVLPSDTHTIADSWGIYLLAVEVITILVSYNVISCLPAITKFGQKYFSSADFMIFSFHFMLRR